MMLSLHHLPSQSLLLLLLLLIQLQLQCHTISAFLIPSNLPPSFTQDHDHYHDDSVRTHHPVGGQRTRSSSRRSSSSSSRSSSSRSNSGTGTSSTRLFYQNPNNHTDINVPEQLQQEQQAKLSTTSTSKATATTTATTVKSKPSSSSSVKPSSSLSNDDIRIIFSDVDGTLVHYPKEITTKKQVATTMDTSLLALPPSATGKRGFLSSKTLRLVQNIRRTNKTPFVLVSGMRTSTLLSRLPYLPKADAYCAEGGGRIFYPVEEAQYKMLMDFYKDDETDDDSDPSSGVDAFRVEPVAYEGASDSDLKPFYIVEDLEWRSRIEEVAGPFGPTTLEELANPESDISRPSPEKSIQSRKGALWDFARHLISKGYVLDTKGYSASFRVNEKHQHQQKYNNNKERRGRPTIFSSNRFQLLRDGTITPSKGLSTSVNLKNIDYYPSISGKKNCCQYLAEKFSCHPSSQLIQETTTKEEDLLSNHAICMGDDDNDLEMALACQHAYVPKVSSTTMEESISTHPNQFTTTGIEDDNSKDVNWLQQDIRSSEVSLSLIWTRLLKQEEEQAKQQKQLLEEKKRKEQQRNKKKKKKTRRVVKDPQLQTEGNPTSMVTAKESTPSKTSTSNVGSTNHQPKVKAATNTKSTTATTSTSTTTTPTPPDSHASSIDAAPRKTYTIVHGQKKPKDKKKQNLIHKVLHSLSMTFLK